MEYVSTSIYHIMQHVGESKALVIIHWEIHWLPISTYRTKGKPLLKINHVVTIVNVELFIDKPFVVIYSFKHLKVE